MMSYSSKRRILNSVRAIVLAMLTLVVFIPLILVVSSSFKNESEIFDFPFHLIPRNPIFTNFERLKENFPIYTANSVKVTFLSTLVQLVTASTGAYAFAKLKWRGRGLIFSMYLASMMIPTQAITIPQFFIVRHFGLYDTHAAIIVLGAFTAVGTFLIRQFFLTIPDTYLEAARIDGAREWRIFLTIMLPMSKSVLVTQAIFSFRFFWNELFVPLIYITSPHLKTLPLGMTDFVTDQYTYWGPQLAAALISMIPVIIIFLLGQKYFIEGVSSSGLKG